MEDGRDGAPPGAVVVVGASAGGVEALSRLAADLDPDLLGVANERRRRDLRTALVGIRTLP